MPIDYENPAPLYVQVAEDISEKIVSGELKYGDQLPSQMLLSKQYNVSLITIKRAIAELCREGLLFGRVGKGVFVGKVEKKERKGLELNKTIGLVLSDLINPFFSLIVRGIEDAASVDGYDVLFSSSKNTMAREEAQVRYFEKLGVGGLIIASMEHVYYATDYMKELMSRRFPFVLVSYMEDKSVNYVGVDHELGGFLATQHLIKLGYKKIACITGEEGNLCGLLRFRGYKKALESYGLEVNPHLLFRLNYQAEKNDFKAGYQIGREFDRFDPRPDAVFTYNDLTALGFKKALLEKGLKIPEDIALVGFDDIEMAEHCAIPLTTIRQPTFRIGQIAFEVLCEKIKGDRSVTRKILKPELVVRESCGALLQAARRSFQTEVS